MRSIELAENHALAELAQLSDDSVIALGVGIGGARPTRQFGSGFFINTGGHLITCHHVVVDMNKEVPAAAAHIYCVGVGSPIVWTYEAEIVRMSSCPAFEPQQRPPTDPVPTDPMLDLAIFRVTRRLDGTPLPAASFKPITFANSDAVVVGEPVWVLGYGQQRSDLTNTRNTMKGIVSGRHTDAAGRKFIRTDAEMLSGHSGGPVVNKSFKVLGWTDVSHADSVVSGGTFRGAVTVRETVDGRTVTKTVPVHAVHDPTGGGIPPTVKVHGSVCSGGVHAMKPILDAMPELEAAGVMPVAV